MRFEEVETMREKMSDGQMSDWHCGRKRIPYLRQEPLCGEISRLRFASLEMTGRFVVPPLAGGKVVRSTKGGRDRRSRKVLRIDRPLAGGFLRLTQPRLRGLWYRPADDEFYSASFGGHVHIKYHNQDYHRPPLRHFVALFP